MSSQITYDVDPTYGCWLWTGKLGSNGRPVVWRGRKPSSAHIVVYEIEVGPVPDDRVLDHRCRRVLCVRPSHLEPVTKSVNEMRKSWSYRVRTMKRCPSGHALDRPLVTPEMGILCRECDR